MIEVTVSQVLDYWKCPQLHWYKHVLKRGLSGEYKGAADLGTLAHTGLENFMTTLMPEHADIREPSLEVMGSERWWDLKAKLIAEYAAKGGELKPNESTAAEALTARLAWWVRESGDWHAWTKVLAAEKVFRYEVAPGVWLRGKADAFVVYQGKVWHVQWKTHSGGLANLEILVESSMHEATFKAGAKVLYPDYEYGGTMLGAFDKEPLHTKLKGAKCAHCGRAGYQLKPHRPYCNIKYLDICDEFVSDAHMAIVEAAAGINDQFNFYGAHPEVDFNTVQWPRNLHSCADMFKKHLCGYRAGVCQRRASIMDQFKYIDIDPQSHYKEPVCSP
jgi:hypothetical protein